MRDADSQEAAVNDDIDEINFEEVEKQLNCPQKKAKLDEDDDMLISQDPAYLS